jgi:hypothetical protein
MRAIILNMWENIDHHIKYTLLTRIWSILAGALSLLMIPIFLTGKQQGFYFSFSSVLAAQVFFELGLNQVLIQLVSHHKFRQSSSSKDKLLFEHEDASYYSLISITKKWNYVAASVLSVTLIPVGMWFFGKTQELEWIYWGPVWIILVILTGVNLFNSSLLAISEGLNKVGQVALVRLASSLVGYSLCWIILICGGGLWSLVAPPLTLAIVSHMWLRREPIFGYNIREIRSLSVTQYRIYSYFDDIFPLQWRIALSWASGYFLFQLITPTIFAIQGAESAGQIGLALAIFTSITAVGMSWISAKLPFLAQLAAINNRVDLDSHYKFLSRMSLFSNILFVFIALLAIEFLSFYFPNLRERFPEITILMLLGLSAIANTAVFSMATYMRAHNVEPMVVQSVSIGMLSGVGVIVGAYYDTIFSILAYAFVSSVIAPLWCYSKFRAFKIEAAKF